MTQICMFCGGDASEPDHRAHCDGRQGHVEALYGSQGDVPYAAGSATSKAAAASVNLAKQEALVYRALQSGPLSNEQICERTGLPMQSAAARVSGLQLRGLVEDSGETIYNAATKRDVKLWRIVVGAPTKEPKRNTHGAWTREHEQYRAALAAWQAGASFADMVTMVSPVAGAILRCVVETGGTTCDAIEQALGRRHSTIQGRLSPMVRAGLLVLQGGVRKTRFDKYADVLMLATR